MISDLHLWAGMHEGSPSLINTYIHVRVHVVCCNYNYAKFVNCTASDQSLLSMCREIPGHPVVYLKTGASPPTPLTPVLPSSVEFDSDAEIFDVTITFINSVTSFHVQMIGSDYSVSNCVMCAMF